MICGSIYGTSWYCLISWKFVSYFSSAVQRTENKEQKLIDRYHEISNLAYLLPRFGKCEPHVLSVYPPLLQEVGDFRKISIRVSWEILGLQGGWSFRGAPKSRGCWGFWWIFQDFDKVNFENETHILSHFSCLCIIVALISLVVVSIQAFFIREWSIRK